MTDQQFCYQSEDHQEQQYQLQPLATPNGDHGKRYASPQECRARITCNACGGYDDFAYEELSTKNGWERLAGQGIYECRLCATIYTLDDVLPGSTFPSAWIYWDSKDAAISHLSWLESQKIQPPPTIMNSEPSTVYEIANKLAQDGFGDSDITVRDGILSVSLLAPFRQFESGKHADCIKTVGFAFKSNASEEIAYAVRLHIGSHPYNPNSEPDIPAIQASAAQAPALIYLQPKGYASFLRCIRRGPDLLETQLGLIGERIMEEIAIEDD